MADTTSLLTNFLYRFLAVAGFYIGSDDPENNVTANVGSLYIRTSGGSQTTLYVKESGTGNTGWVGK